MVSHRVEGYIGCALVSLDPRLLPAACAQDAALGIDFRHKLTELPGCTAPNRAISQYSSTPITGLESGGRRRGANYAAAPTIRYVRHDAHRL